MLTGVSGSGVCGGHIKKVGLGPLNPVGDLPSSADGLVARLSAECMVRVCPTAEDSSIVGEGNVAHTRCLSCDSIFADVRQFPGGPNQTPCH